MQKRNARYHTKLIEELQLLRKGGGLTLEKNRQGTPSSEVTARSLGVDVNGITNCQVYNLLLTEISKLPHTSSVKALRFAFSLAEDAKTVETLVKRRQLVARSLGKMSIQ